jgi:hypothetical protein
MHFLRLQEKEKWIKDYISMDTAGARIQVEDAHAAVRKELEDTETTENVGLTTTEPEKMCPEMMVAIRGSLSHIASLNHGEDGEDEDDADTEQDKISENDKPGWVMGTVAKRVKLHMERFREMQMEVDQLTQQ